LPYYYFTADPNELDDIYDGIAAILPSLDTDRDGIITDACPDLCLTDGACDADDSNICISEKAPEGFCVVSKAECEGLWTEVECSGANNNVCSLYRDNNVLTFYSACDYEDIPDGSGKYYAGCTDELDNDQDTNIDEEEISCPKEGGIVPCGRYADDPSTEDIDESQPCGFCHFFFLFTRILGKAVAIAAVIGVLFVVFGGAAIATSRGSANQLMLGKNIIIWTFIGLAVMLIGFIVLNSFFARIGVQKWTGVGGETGVVESVFDPGGDTIGLVTDHDDWEDDDWNGLAVTITESANSELIGETKIIIDTIDSGLGDIIETERWPADPIGSEFKIGGWWKFVCGLESP